VAVFADARMGANGSVRVYYGALAYLYIIVYEHKRSYLYVRRNPRARMNRC
jgi:hypothetical protein